jgi:hypothetical protein
VATNLPARCTRRPCARTGSFVLSATIKSLQRTSTTSSGRTAAPVSSPLIAELKGAFGIGKVPSADFDANHAALLIKLLSHNLLRRYAIDCAPALAARRAPWIRRALIEGPGRFGRHGRSFRLRLAPRPHLIN